MLDDVLFVRDEIARAMALEDWPWLADGDADAVCAFIVGRYYAAGISVESSVHLSSGITLILSRQSASVIIEQASRFQWAVPFADFYGYPFSFAVVVLQCITLAYLRIG